MIRYPLLNVLHSVAMSVQATDRNWVCACGVELVTVKQVVSHWQNGHFDFPTPLGLKTIEDPPAQEKYP